MKIALFNDTGHYPHVGCRAVSSGLARMLDRCGVEVAYRSFYGEWRELGHEDPATALLAFNASLLPESFQGLDAVIVNGEGTIHHGRGRHLLAVLAGAQALGIPTLLVNAVVQALDETDLDVLRGLHDLAVRDAASSAYLTAHDITHRVVLDAVLEAAFVDEPSVNASGKVLVTDAHGGRPEVGRWLQALRERLGAKALDYPLAGRVPADRWAHAVADVRSARLVVTGRHHGIYLALIAGVPVVACGSNTWKIEGLLAMLPGALTVCARAEDLRQACARAVAHPERAETARQWAAAQLPLQTFQWLERAA